MALPAKQLLRWRDSSASEAGPSIAKQPFGQEPSMCPASEAAVVVVWLLRYNYNYREAAHKIAFIFYCFYYWSI